MIHTVVLEADWFTVDKVKYIKKLAYFAPTLGLFGEVSFGMPPGFGIYCKDLKLQSRCSHEIDWREIGDYRHDEVHKALQDVIYRLGTTELEFYAKGLEKCKFLERYARSVVDLDTTGCPRFDELCQYKKTTLQKAIVFGQWLQWSL